MHNREDWRAEMMLMMMTDSKIHFSSISIYNKISKVLIFNKISKIHD